MTTMTFDEALALAEEIADPDFPERYAAMKARLAEYDRIANIPVGYDVVVTDNVAVSTEGLTFSRRVPTIHQP